MDWNFNVTYNDQPAVAAMAEEYKDLIEHPGLYPAIPPEWLHATILRVGTTDEYSEEEMLSVAEEVQTEVAGLTLPKFTFARWSLLEGNVCFHLTPEDEFTKLHDIVIASLKKVIGLDRVAKSSTGNFFPHTNLAYTKTHENEGEIHDSLAASHIEPATFEVKHMPLIRQWPTDGHYKWEVVKDILVTD